MNARLAFGGLLLLGIADFGLINLKLAPEYAEDGGVVELVVLDEGDGRAR